MSTTKEETVTELSDSEKLYRLAEKTGEDGFVQLELTDWDMTDGEIKLSLISPYGEEVTKKLDRPKSDSDEYEIVRVLDSVGYGIASLGTACNESVNIPADPENDWELAPDYTHLSRRVEEWVDEELEGSASKGSLASAIALTIISPVAYICTFLPIASGRANDFAYGIFAGFSGALLWITSILLIFSGFLFSL
jgi:hypothetical protein